MDQQHPNPDAPLTKRERREFMKALPSLLFFEAERQSAALERIATAMEKIERHLSPHNFIPAEKIANGTIEASKVAAGKPKKVGKVRSAKKRKAEA